jgi:hypothetical protein
VNYTIFNLKKKRGGAHFDEQFMYIRFCFKPGKTATETYEMLKLVLEEETISRSETPEYKVRSNNF